MNKPRTQILLAEDCREDVELALNVLTSLIDAERISVVSDGEEALDFMYRRGRFAERPPGNPAMVLLDLKMPKIDGLEVLRTVKSDRMLRTTPVVMLTSSREVCDVTASYRLGVNAYVVKPVGFQQFVDAMTQIRSFWTLHNEPPPDPVVMPA